MKHEPNVSITLTKKQLQVLLSCAYRDRTCQKDYIAQLWFELDGGSVSATDGNRLIVLAASRLPDEFITERAGFGLKVDDVERVVRYMRGTDEVRFSRADGKPKVTVGDKEIEVVATEHDFPTLPKVFFRARHEDDTAAAIHMVNPRYMAMLGKVADALVTKSTRTHRGSCSATCHIQEDKLSPLRYEVEDPDTSGPAVWYYWIMPMSL